MVDSSYSSLARRWHFLHLEEAGKTRSRSEEHTSELQSLAYLVCRLLLEKKKKNTQTSYTLNTYQIHIIEQIERATNNTTNETLMNSAKSHHAQSLIAHTLHAHTPRPTP